MVAAARLDSSSGSAVAAPSGSTHSVERGETLSQIARDNGVSLKDLLAANPQIANPNRIYVGDRVNVPAANGDSAAAPPQGGGANALSQSGLDLIKGFEGLRLSAYQDSAGVWTIGYGHTGNVKPGDRITQAQADELLQKDTAWAQQAVRDQVKVPLTQGQFDALTSFTFNLGAGALAKSTLLSKLNAGDYGGAQAEFGKWVHAGGQVLQGLVRRRAAEAELFGNNAPQGGAAPAPTPSAPSSAAPSGPSSAPAGGDYSVKRGDTLWDIARAHGVSLQSLIAANPQIDNPNLIMPGQQIHLPGASRSAGAAPVASAGAVGDAGDAASIARQFVGRNASELKRSGELPMDDGVPSNICCANFVSAVLQKAGLLPASQHTNSVDQLDSTLRARGWQPVSAANARPGDVVIIQGGGVSHSVMVESNNNGQLRLIGSNNVNADGTQKVSVGSADWALRHGAVILTPPAH
jgi:spore coat assembly protein SafA